MAFSVWGCGKPNNNVSPLTPAPQTGVANAQPAPILPASASDWFQAAGPESGVSFTLGHKAKGPFVVRDLMGGGVSICDFDGDGHADLFLVAPQDIAPGTCFKLYRNQGKGQFTDVSAGSGIDASGMIMGCSVGDIDNDGRPDLLVTGYGINKLYKNLGDFKFQDITAGSGLEAPSPTSWATSAAFADYDNDGKLDVFIGRYVIFNDKTIQLCDYGQGRMASCGPVFYDPQRGNLFRNVGGGKFRDVTEAAGFNDVHGKVLGVAWADVNGDLIPDCYLANDEVNADFFLSGGKDKKFKNVGLTAGVALAPDGKPQGGMGVDFGDYNRDGHLDIFVTTFQFEPNSLYSGGQGGLYQPQSLSMGLDQTTRLMVGFGTKFLDVDNDGWLDIAIANGHIHDNQESIDKQTTYREPMQLFMNSKGTAYVDRSKEAGPSFTTPGVGRGLAVGDLDDDGREDVVIMDMEGPTRILFNRAPNTGNWLRIALKGTTSNRMGLGAAVTVIAGSEKWIGNCTMGGSYLASSDPRLHFGLGSVKAVDSVEVRWPSGKRSVVKTPRVNGDITIEEPR